MTAFARTYRVRFSRNGLAFQTHIMAYDAADAARKVSAREEVPIGVIWGVVQVRGAQ